MALSAALPGLLYFWFLNTYRCGSCWHFKTISRLPDFSKANGWASSIFACFNNPEFLSAIRCCYRSIISSSFSRSDYISTLVKRSKAFVLQTHDSNDDLRSAFYIDGHRGKPDVRVPNHGRGAVNERFSIYGEQNPISVRSVMVPPRNYFADDLEGMRLGTIIFLAALAAVDVEQYEAATIDGQTVGGKSGISHCRRSATRS